MTQRKIKSLLAEIFFVCFCLFGCGYSVYQFWLSLNKALTKNEEQIATITFKYKTAQRKFEDDLIWDRLQQHSPIYDGDTIRTAPMSEATIYFNDGNVMNLYENTLAQVRLNDDGTNEIDFDGGQIEIQTSKTSGMKIKSGTSLVNIEKGTSVATDKTSSGSKELNVQVQSGTVALTDTVTGEVKANLKAGQTATMDKAGNV